MVTRFGTFWNILRLGVEENSIEAEKDGKVTAIAVKVGQAVLEDEPLVVIE